MALAKKIHQARHTSAFEIEGLIYYKQGELEKAIEVLRECVEKFPELWPCTQLLGSCLSDLGQYDEAETQYRLALAHAGEDKDVVFFNLATLYSRQDKYFEAIRVADQIRGEEWRIPLIKFKLDLYLEHEKYDQVIRLGEPILESYEGPLDFEDENLLQDEGGSSFSIIAAKLARAYFALRRPPAEIEDFLLYWLSEFFSSESLLEAYRICFGNRKKKAKYLRVLVEVTFDKITSKRVSALGFQQQFYLYADSPEAGLKFAMELDSEYRSQSWKIDESEIIETVDDVLLGVVYRSPRYFYESLDEE